MNDAPDHWWNLLSGPDQALVLKYRHRPLIEPVIDRLAAAGQLETGDHPYWMPEDLAAFLDEQAARQMAA
ncbi:hypothetical protein Lfu02_05960 [Longispora fulva]|uniref:Uncharacterized protein n=1 Tax=Longispora fulva TaxID=619741 RepID=A0A8J7GDB9_9ACTN|nr:hypothetical protein [Longispora fulva]MBG6135536.1 hypothetical protein [Longispora fulva]GIG56224.1 hypothetical protein Lfu02_05960 [Longispora fulva]